MTSGDVVIVPLTLASGVVVCRWCRLAAGRSPPAVARLGDPNLLDPEWTFAMSSEESVAEESTMGRLIVEAQGTAEQFHRGGRLFDDAQKSFRIGGSDCACLRTAPEILEQEFELLRELIGGRN